MQQEGPMEAHVAFVMVLGLATICSIVHAQIHTSDSKKKTLLKRQSRYQRAAELSRTTAQAKRARRIRRARRRQRHGEIRRNKDPDSFTARVSLFIFQIFLYRFAATAPLLALPLPLPQTLLPRLPFSAAVCTFQKNV